MSDAWKNKLYFGDNLDILREHIADESVDLIYLDPPFNSQATYNVLYQEKSGEKSAAQITAFEDTWHWGLESEETYRELVSSAPKKLADLMQALRLFLGQNDMMAYLTMMAARLLELRRVLKATGTIYLHCDPTASHYLKILMDAVFGPERFLNEIAWKRTHAHGASLRYGPVHDTLLYYAKTERYTWTEPTIAHDSDYIAKHFRHVEPDSGRRFQPISLTGAGVRRGESGQPWRGVDPTKVGRHWALPRDICRELGITGGTVQDRLDALDRAGLIYWPKTGDGTPRLKWYADRLRGQAIPDIWTDINPISARAQERLGYPTQKPEALLERIVKSSSNEGDIVLDPFCGCGTAIAVAERLHRRWIGIDITHLAITLIRHRLHDAFGSQLAPYQVIGDPKDLASAEALANENRHQFEWWALGLVDARPAHDKKKGADTGVDGYIYFFDDESGKAKQVIVQVKSGSVSVSHVRDLKGVLEREKAPIGLLITLREPTRPMRDEALAAGFYEPEHFIDQRFPRVQILTIKELLEGKGAAYPKGATATFKKAERQRKAEEAQAQLL